MAVLKKDKIKFLIAIFVIIHLKFVIRNNKILINPTYNNYFINLNFNLLTLIYGLVALVLNIWLFTSDKASNLRRILVIGDREWITRLILCLSWLSLSSLLLSNSLLKSSDCLGPYLGPHLHYLLYSYPASFISTTILYYLAFRNTCLQAQLFASLFLVIIFEFLDFSYLTLYISITTSVIISAVVCSLLALALNSVDYARRKSSMYLRVHTVTLLILVFVIALWLHHPWSMLKHQDVVGHYRILDHKESLTGWLSVAEDDSRRIRVLRAGNSLLGGIFLGSRQSIYGVFHLMEAVYLIPRSHELADQSLKALQIGLGIGVAYKGLIERGVLVDVVELDPAVVELAENYFEIPQADSVYIKDGRQFIEESKPGKYDFVLHDVFTGGTVAETLFSVEALNHISRILKHGGVMALNFVAISSLQCNPTFWTILKTVKSIFPYVRCYKDSESQEDKIVNFILFASQSFFTFRSPTIEEMGGNYIRQYMWRSMDKLKVNVDEISLGDDPCYNHYFVATDEFNPLPIYQEQSALLHWYTMREIFPSYFWSHF